MSQLSTVAAVLRHAQRGKKVEPLMRRFPWEVGQDDPLPSHCSFYTGTSVLFMISMVQMLFVVQLINILGETLRLCIYPVSPQTFTHQSQHPSGALVGNHHCAVRLCDALVPPSSHTHSLEFFWEERPFSSCVCSVLYIRMNSGMFLLP